MSRSANSSPPAFPTTRWSLVSGAGRADGGAEHLSALLQAYLPALRAHLVFGRRFPPERADDLLQGFVASRILEKNLIARADRARGRFRSFLLASLDNYVRNELRDAGRQKRSAGPPPEPVGEAVADGAALPASEAFDVAWARSVVLDALRRMEEQCHAAGRSDLWALFRRRVVLPAFEGAEPVPYEQLVREFAFASPAQAANALTTAKRMFDRMLRAVVSEYAGEGADADEEIADLRAILARPRA